MDPTNLLRAGLKFLADQQIQYASDPITYARGYDSIDLRAIFDRERLKVADAEGFVRIEYTDMSFRMRPGDLVLGGEQVTPERGDLIHVPDGYDVYTFQVTPFEGEPAWSYLDPHHHFLIVRTKRVNIERWS